MKDRIIALLAALLALARTPKDEEDSITAQIGQIDLKRDEISTFHGDDDFASNEVSDLLDDLIEVTAASEPDPNHAEVPELQVEGEKKKKAKSKSAPPAPAPAPEEETTEEDEQEEEEAEKEKVETPKERRIRLKQEAANKETAKKKSVKKK